MLNQGEHCRKIFPFSLAISEKSPLLCWCHSQLVLKTQVKRLTLLPLSDDLRSQLAVVTPPSDPPSHHHQESRALNTGTSPPGQWGLHQCKFWIGPTPEDCLPPERQGVWVGPAQSFTRRRSSLGQDQSGTSCLEQCTTQARSTGRTCVKKLDLFPPRHL